MDYHRALGTSVNTVSKQHTQSNMNKRIKELAEQAGEYVNVYIGHVDWHRQFHQKFAELIVKECADLYDKSADDWFGTDTKYILKLYAERIKKHFGVE
jgi:hypothetical protein